MALEKKSEEERRKTIRVGVHTTKTHGGFQVPLLGLNGLVGRGRKSLDVA